LSLYTNKDVVAVDQDSLGKAGKEIASSGGADVMAKPLANGDVAVVLFNENSSAQTISTSASAIGIASASSYKLDNLWSKVITSTSGAISATVPGHGSVMYRVSAGSGSSVGTAHALVGASSGRCLDVPNGSTTTGTQLDIWDCNSGSNQSFTPTSGKALQVYSGSLCLDASGQGTTAGTKVITWTCNGQTNQQWNLNADGTITGVQSGLCLDVTGGNVASGNVNGALVELWGCNGGANQQWKLG
jgi:alpha-galactosidase